MENGYYIAHIKKTDGTVQSIRSHCKGVARLAADFAEEFGAGDIAYQCGLAHDIGKYSELFQKRIRGAHVQVDHSTAGAREMNRMGCLPGAYCVAGHHAGLMDGGGRFDRAESTVSLHARLNKQLEDYSAFREEISLRKPTMPRLNRNGNGGFSVSFFIRMLYSALVDADFLDTEAFMGQGRKSCKGEKRLSLLREQLLDYIQLRGWLEGKYGLAAIRSEILSSCIEKGTLHEQGLFTLTVPTGGGKTVASMAFALEHAKKHHLQRIIYVIPYCAIIDQTVEQYKAIFGEEPLLAHYSEAEYGEPGEEDNEDHPSRSLALENWDMPIVVTTAVQFFESLFSNRSSKCRKLHNIARSVVVFDEAQTLPLEYLRPCISAIAELVSNYGTSCILCTATQPALEPFFLEYCKNIQIREIMDNPERYHFKLNRVTWKDLGELEVRQLIERLMSCRQVLCIVSTRKEAKDLYGLLDSEGSFHLSTLMTAVDRRKKLWEIRDRLLQNKECRVISTSLIEAGVDIDFPVVFRERAGLDSVVQAGGRCNREGKRPMEDSLVCIFDMKVNRRRSGGANSMAAAEKWTTAGETDFASPRVIRKYFNQLYYWKTSGETGAGQDMLDQKDIVASLEDGITNGGSFPFASVAERFHMIDDRSTRTVFIPHDEKSADYAKILLGDERNVSRFLIRKAGAYCVNLYRNHYEEIQSGLLETSCGISVLADLSLYSSETGLAFSREEGDGFFLC